MEGVGAIERQTLSSWTPAMLNSELKVGNGKRFVAFAPSGDLVGWCCIRILAPEAELLKITVDLTTRKCGVGNLLLHSIYHELRTDQIATLFLEVRSANHGAIEFYNRNGFNDVGRRPNYYNDPKDDALIFQKEL